MHRALWKKSIGEGQWLFVSLAVTLFAFCWIRARLVAQIETSRFETIVENLPDYVNRLFPVPLEEFITYPARIAMGFEEPLAYLVMAVWCFARGSDVVSGELGRGTMEMLLSQPVRRIELLWTHIAVVLIGVALLAIVAFAGTYAGIETTMVEVEPSSSITLWGVQVPWFPSQAEPQYVPLRELMDTALLWPAVINYMSLGVFLAGIATLLSSCDRYRWRTIGCAVGFYIVQTVFELLGLAFDQLSWLRYVTFFSAYEPVRFVADAVRSADTTWQVFATEAVESGLVLGPLGYDLLLGLLGLMGFGLATVIFCRRDLPAPV